MLTELVATLARLLTRGGNRVGRDPLQQRRRAHDPAARRAQAGAAPRPRPAAAADRGGRRPPTSAGSFRAGARTRSAAARWCSCVSDFISEPGWERALALLGAAPRGGRDPPLGPARGRAARRRRRRDAGRRDRRADVRRHQRPAVPPPLRDAAARAPGASSRAAFRRAGVDLYDISTDDDLVRALVRMVGHAQAAAVADDRFLAARVLLSLLAGAGARRRPTSWLVRAPGAPAGRARHDGLVQTPRRAGRSAGAATSPPAMFLVGVVVLLVGARPPRGDGRPAAPGRNGDPRVRRVDEHEGGRPRADAHGGGEAGGADLRGRPAVDDPDRRRGFSDAASSCSRRRASKADVLARDRPALAAGRDRRWARGSSRRSARSPGKPHRRSTREALEAGAAATRHGVPRLRRRWCCSPTVRTPRGSTRWRWPTSASQAGVRIFPIGIGSEQGTVVEVDGFSVATRLDEGLLREIAKATQRWVLPGRGHCAARTDLRHHRPQAHHRATRRRRSRASSPAAAADVPARGRRLSMRWFGRAP